MVISELNSSLPIVVQRLAGIFNITVEVDCNRTCILLIAPAQGWHLRKFVNGCVVIAPLAIRFPMLSLFKMNLSDVFMLILYDEI